MSLELFIYLRQTVRDRICKLFSQSVLSLKKKAFWRFNVYKCFASMYLCDFTGVVVHMEVRRGIRSPSSVVIRGCKLPCQWWGPNLGLLQKQQELILVVVVVVWRVLKKSLYRESREKPQRYEHRRKISEQNSNCLWCKIENQQMGPHKIAKFL